MPTRSPTGREVRTLLTRSSFRWSVVRSVRCRTGRQGDRASARSVGEGVAAVGSRLITRTVSSPAMVPRTSSSSALSNARGEELRGAGRGAQHDQVGGGVGRRPAARRTAGPAGSRRPPLARRRAGCGRRPRRARRRRARRRRPRTLTASSSTRSRDSVAWVTRTPRPASSSASSVCERTSWWASRSTIRCWRALLVGRDCAASFIDRCSSEPGEQRLLGVQPVLGLVPDDALRAVDDLGGDLLAAVGRQAVHARSRRRAAWREQLGGRAA